MLHTLLHFYNAAPPKAKSAARAGAAFLAGAAIAVVTTACSPAYAQPVGRGKIAPGAEKHHGFGDPSISRRSSRAHFGERLFFVHVLRMARTAFLFGGPCGDTRKGVPVPTAGSPTPHGLPPPFGDGEGRFQTCSVGAIMADTLTLKGRIAPAAPTSGADESQLFALHLEAVNCAALARWYAARHRHTEAARKMRQGLAALNRLKTLEAA